MRFNRVVVLVTSAFVVVGLAGAGLLAGAVAEQKMEAAAPKAEKSLYERLGKYDAIAAVVDDFIGRLLADPQFMRFFSGASADSKGRIRQLIVDQLCSLTGGPCVYLGRDMKKAHAGLGITEADWDASVKHLTAALDKFKVPEKEKSEVLTAVSAFKKDIVEKAQ